MNNMQNYEETYSAFKWKAPKKYNFARDVIDAWASKAPGLEAMLWIDDEGNELRRTFTDFSVASKKLCNILSDAGIQRGDVVIVILGRQIQWWEVFTAVLRMPYQTILPGMLVVNLALIFRNTRTNVPRMRAHIISLFVLPVASVLFGMVIFVMIGLLVMLVITMMA